MACYYFIYLFTFDIPTIGIKYIHMCIAMIKWCKEKTNSVPILWHRQRKKLLHDELMGNKILVEGCSWKFISCHWIPHYSFCLSNSALYLPVVHI